ncbi:MAG: hypothetical protein AB2806_15350, partial [Candidatus Thiodiazotropha sp.]
ASANVAEAGLRIQALSPKVIKTPIARTEAEESVRLSQKYALDEISESQFDTMEARMVALNTPLSYRQVNRMRHDAAFLKEWLLDKLSSASNLTRCDLYDRLRRVQIEALTGKDVNGELAEFSASARALKQLVQIFVEYLIDCICLALTPPCQPCDDHGVLLACVTVKDCEVIDICNMSRRFVLTPVAMRYWLPPIGMIGDLLKRLCCDLDMDKLLGSKERVPEDRHPQKTVEMFLMTRPEEMSIAKTYAPVMSEAALDDDTAQVLKRFRIEPRDVETVTAFSSNLALLSARAVDIQPAAIANRGAAIAAAISDRFNTTAPATLVESTPYDRVAEVIEKEVSAARKRVVSELESNLDRSVDESLKKARTELAETVKKDLGGTLDKRVTQDVKTAVARELTEAKLRRAIQGTDTVKTLKEESRKLTRELKKLSDAVEALKTGGSS